ncbi:TOBE domain-containing protein [uncultured Desulfobacter sp.]|uniref:TOBE domain-containing protein n=1 Tax=uncultured Desulfobacter sp. TaxID=240139 RepID=UPI002AAA6FA5|nr:TOBE domain-containing protein [uncultured Desulfobacter sp.]
MDDPQNENLPASISQKPAQGGMDQGRMVSIPEQDGCLDSVQLDRLEHEFRTWATDTPRTDVRLSRQRILIIFLLIRYTGAKLNEILALNPFSSIDLNHQVVDFSPGDGQSSTEPRQVRISTALAAELKEMFNNPLLSTFLEKQFNIDPGFVRRKFYERAQSLGFPKHLGGPEMIRKARAVELMQRNMPMPAVQTMLGHSTINLTSRYVSFSKDDIATVTKLFIEREASRKTSARNSFYGKIKKLQKGDIQTQIALTTAGGDTIEAVITNSSVERLALKEGRLIMAEVKAPLVCLYCGKQEPKCTAENRFLGVIEQINAGKINTEYTIRINDGTTICAIVSTQSSRWLGLGIGDWVWAAFSCFAVVLNVD